jgi:hypothetical protein
LVGISPMVWRRVVVPMGCTLRELHGVFQIAMGDRPEGAAVPQMPPASSRRAARGVLAGRCPSTPLSGVDYRLEFASKWGIFSRPIWGEFTGR